MLFLRVEVVSGDSGIVLTEAISTTTTASGLGTLVTEANSSCGSLSLLPSSRLASSSIDV